MKTISIRRYLIMTGIIIGMLLQTYGESEEHAVVIYGATASGTIAAIAAANEGIKVLLIEPGSNVGGMVTGGLSHNDYGDLAVIGGLAKDYYQRVADYYKKPIYYWRGPEPHVGEMIFRNWLEKSGVEILFDRRVTEVIKYDNTIEGILLSNGDTVNGQVFVDASYEGDLMAMAGVSYTVGREGVTEYGESWAGRRAILPDGHQMLPGISPFDEQGRLLPLINPVPMVGEGEGDRAVQGYGFRLIVTDQESNRVPFPKPDQYDPGQFELVKRYYQAYPEAGNMVHFWPTLPNGKADMNSSGPISTNVIDGLNWEYPDADYKKRVEIWQAMKDYTLGLLYFLSHDASVPEYIRQETSRIGLCRDEFTDNGYWPHQLYIRVARRMKGEYIMTQHDLETDTVKYDAIGMGSYNIDVRHVQRTFIPVSRFPELRYEVYNEGYISIPVAPYEIPYRSLLPKFSECDNLLVPVCMSTSFIANASIRMEPQYMILGQAAGVAAAMAASEGRKVHHIDIAELQSRLEMQGQIISLCRDPYGAFRFDGEIIIDNNMKRFVRKTGSWASIETEHNGRFRMNYAINDQEQGSFGFRPWIPEGGRYEIYIWYPSDNSYAESVSLKVNHLGGTKIMKLNQRHNGGGWLSLGVFELDSGRWEVITLVADRAAGTVAADAIRLVKLE